MKIGVYSFEDGKEPKDLEKQIKVLKKQLRIAVEALKSLRTEQTVIDKATGDVYYIWDYALKQIKELDK